MPTEHYDPTGQRDGLEAASEREGRNLTFEESVITHPAHTDGLVDKGDACLVGDTIVGIAETSAIAATDPIAIDTEAVRYKNVIANGNMNRGAVVYIDPITAVLSDDANDVPFGYILSPLTASQTPQLVAVKVHAHFVGVLST